MNIHEALQAIEAGKVVTRPGRDYVVYLHEIPSLGYKKMREYYVKKEEGDVERYLGSGVDFSPEDVEAQDWHEYRKEEAK